MDKPHGITRSVKSFIVEGKFLNQLLECPVCLGQLTSSSRVLPCQHTFCQSCLNEVYKAKKRLDCPECRTPVNIPFESLPRNILLVRFLEGVKNKKVRNAEDFYPSSTYPRSTIPLSRQLGVLPQSSTNLTTAAYTTATTRDTHTYGYRYKMPDVFKKMKEDPNYKYICKNFKVNMRRSEVSAPPSISVKRMSVPKQPCTSVRMPIPEQPCTSVRMPIPEQPCTSVRMPIPEQSSQPSNSAKNIPPSDENAKVLENRRRLYKALQAHRAVYGNPLAKMSTESNTSTTETEFQKRNKHIMSKIMTALTYPNSYSYTGPRQNGEST